MKIKYYIISLLLLAITITSCQDELVDKYTDPEKVTEANIPALFAGMLDNNRVRPSYWNLRTFLLLQPAVYTQSASYSNSLGKYQASTSYTQQYWNNFYVNSSNGSGALGVYVAMDDLYEAQTETEQSSNEIFMNAAKVVLIDEASKMIDMWGDIPYSEVGSLITSSTIVPAKYDDQEELYTEFIAELKTIGEYFSSATTTANFSKYDILIGGEVSKWQEYANSLRLRLLMRISDVDEATAKTAVTEMLNNSASYPLIDGSMTSSYDVSGVDVLLEPLTDYTDNLTSALTELDTYFAPDYMLNTVMSPVDDPRIPVLFDKYGATTGGVFVPNEEFKAMPITYSSEEQSANYMYYAILDSATFLQNTDLPGIVMTASEVNLLKAEAYERWGLGDAQEAFETAVKQSVQFYYYLNNLNTKLTTVDYPADEEVDALITNLDYSAASSEERLEKIYVQKWLHFGFLQSIQSWSEYRRTGYPVLTVEEDTQSGYELPPMRLLYPDDEKTYNADNYAAVKAEDDRDTKIFWDVD